MKANEVDILIIPDAAEANADHWQSRWEAKLSTAARVPAPRAAGRVSPAEWAEAIAQAALSRRKPVILLAHGLGVFAAACAAPRLKDKVCGGFFVSPLSPPAGSAPSGGRETKKTASCLTALLPFPSIVIAGRNTPAGNFAAAEKMAENWHSLFIDAGESGHIDSQSGHGPWPEGLMVFSQFLANLPNPRAEAGAAGESPAPQG